jgi:hypothetical protein
MVINLVERYPSPRLERVLVLGGARAVDVSVGPILPLSHRRRHIIIMMCMMWVLCAVCVQTQRDFVRSKAEIQGKYKGVKRGI